MELITRNPDLKKLYDDGYEIQILDKSHLVIHSVPYLASDNQLAYGILVSTLVLAGDNIVYESGSDHTVHFAGNYPRATDGSKLTSFAEAGGRQELSPGLWTDHTFSAKPTGNYRDYHHKMTVYIKKLGAPLVELGITATAQTFREVASIDNSPFHFADTNSGRAGMTSINGRVSGQKVAILGVGGTGSYVLDFVAKMPVAEIHPFDGDTMLSHNAFRAPGSPTIAQLREMVNKAEYQAETYSRMHKVIKPHSYNVDESRLGELEQFDFVFVCIDGGNDKQKIIAHLIAHSVPFVDVGLNMRVNDGKLRGQIRTTLVTPASAEKLNRYIPTPAPNPDEDIYRSNAQVAEMNALNACHAVLSWKRLNGIYDQLEQPDHSVFKIRNGRLINYEN